MVACVTDEQHFSATGDWAAGLRYSDGWGRFLWDLWLIDSTPAPTAAYLTSVRSWARSRPFPNHRIRLKRFGPDGEGRGFTSREAAQQYGYRLAVEMFTAARSYDHLAIIDDEIPVDLADAMLGWGSYHTRGIWVFHGDLVRRTPYLLTTSGLRAYADDLTARATPPAIHHERVAL